MELVGYEFDDQDTSGRFVVSKMPPELEKMGIKNARMKDAVTTEEGHYPHVKSFDKLWSKFLKSFRYLDNNLL